MHIYKALVRPEQRNLFWGTPYTFKVVIITDNDDYVEDILFDDNHGGACVTWAPANGMGIARLCGRSFEKDAHGHWHLHTIRGVPVAEAQAWIESQGDFRVISTWRALQPKDASRHVQVNAITSAYDDTNYVEEL
jgi:hypothetical protein